MLGMRAVAIWFVLLVGAFANGTFRELVISPQLGAPVAHIISSILFSAIILLIAWLSIRWIRPISVGEAATVGVAWMLLTIAFEFGFGLMRGLTWEQMLSDYNVMNGRLWLLVLITTTVAPVLAGRMHGMFEPMAGRLAHR